MKSRNLAQILDYIITHEHEDFIENLEHQDITPYQKRLIYDWYHDNLGTTKEVENALKDIARSAGGHIYASAICLQYGIEE